MFEKSGLAALTAACIWSAPAGATPGTYDVIFTQTVGSATTESASFVFDSTTQLFSNFVFTFGGNAADYTDRANHASSGQCNGKTVDAASVGGNLGFAIMSGATPCNHDQRWSVANQTRFDSELTFFATTAPVDNPDQDAGPELQGTITDDPYLQGSGFYAGSLTLLALPSGSVPEPGSIALLAIGLLAADNVVRRRRRARRR